MWLGDGKMAYYHPQAKPKMMAAPHREMPIVGKWRMSLEELAEKKRREAEAKRRQEEAIVIDDDSDLPEPLSSLSEPDKQEQMRARPAQPKTVEIQPTLAKTKVNEKSKPESKPKAIIIIHSDDSEEEADRFDAPLPKH